VDYATLKTEIALPSYNGMTDAEIAAALNAVNVAVFVDVDPHDWLETLINTGEWGRIELAAAVAPSGTILSNPTAQDTNVGRLRTFVRACTSPVMIRASKSSVRTVFGSIIDALVSAGFMAANTRTTLIGFASSTISRAAQLGLGTVAVGDVTTARNT